MHFFTITPNNYDKETLEALDSCSAVLKVAKNRNSKYIDKGSVNFSVTLTNTSDNTSTYVLSTKILKEACGNMTSNTSSKNNIDFNVSLQTNSPKNEITLKREQTHKFVITVEIPKDTPYDIWNCIEVIAKSKDCEDSDSAKTVISVYVIDPSKG